MPVFVYKKGSSPYCHLQQLAVAVSCYRPVILQGPVGSGKTSTVEYLAYATGHTTPGSNEDIGKSSLFIKVQLGEKTDSRVLLGGYQCTEIPGQFLWKPGVLTQVMNDRSIKSQEKDTCFNFMFVENEISNFTLVLKFSIE